MLKNKMVIQEDAEPPVDTANLTQSAKKYVIVKNHVRELSLSDLTSAISNTTAENSSKNPETRDKRKTNKSTKGMSYSSDLTDSPDESNRFPHTQHTDISISDLEELRSVYKRCKEVIARIEYKYGHLLDCDEDCSSSNLIKSKRKYETDSSERETCTCPSNKRILYDESGNQIEMGTVPDHICTHKQRRRSSAARQPEIEVEYGDYIDTLPDDLNELGNILRNPDLSKGHRYKVIRKMQSIKLDNTNEIKFHRPALVEQLKVDPEQVLCFKGTNLSTLPGYKI